MVNDLLNKIREEQDSTLKPISELQDTADFPLQPVTDADLPKREAETPFKAADTADLKKREDDLAAERKKKGKLFYIDFESWRVRGMDEEDAIERAVTFQLRDKGHSPDIASTDLVEDGVDTEYIGMHHIMEAGQTPFKPASSTEVAKRKEDAEKARRAKRAAGKEICPSCGVDLHEEGVYSVESVNDSITRNYDWDAEKMKWVEGDIDRSENDLRQDTEDWYCADCGDELREGEDFSIDESKVVEAGTPFKPASKEDLATRDAEYKATHPKKKYKFEYRAYVTVLGVDEDDARNEFDMLSLTPEPAGNLVDAGFIEETDAYLARKQ